MKNTKEVINQISSNFVKEFKSKTEMYDYSLHEVSNTDPMPIISIMIHHLEMCIDVVYLADGNTIGLAIWDTMYDAIYEFANTDDGIKKMCRTLEYLELCLNNIENTFEETVRMLVDIMLDVEPGDYNLMCHLIIDASLNDKILKQPIKYPQDNRDMVRRLLRIITLIPGCYIK